MDIRTKETIKYIVNLIFTVYNIVLGIASHSRWFLAVGLYYMVLSTMRIGVMGFSFKIRKDGEFVMRFTGIMIFILSFVLTGIVYMTINRFGAIKYPEITMITIALFTFIKLTLATVELIKSRKHPNAYMLTIRSISFADAFVSIYSLQRSMLVSFGKMEASDILIFNILAGIGVCVITVGIGVYLMVGKENVPSGTHH